MKQSFDNVIDVIQSQKIDTLLNDKFFRPYGWTQDEVFCEMKKCNPENFLDFITIYTMNTNDTWLRRHNGD